MNNSDLVWYVCYGSNLCYERFMCYLTGEGREIYGLLPAQTADAIILTLRKESRLQSFLILCISQGIHLLDKGKELPLSILLRKAYP